jgi:hypothetical protein
MKRVLLVLGRGSVQPGVLSNWVTASGTDTYFNERLGKGLELYTRLRVSQAMVWLLWFRS